MSRTGSQRRGKDSEHPPRESTGRVERRERIAARKRRAVRGGEGSWLADKRRVLRFVVLLGVGMAGFNVLFFLWLAPGEFFQDYLRLNATASAAVLQVLGDDATVSGTSIISPRYSLNIKRGCEAIQVSAFFVLAVLAWPMSVSRWRRATGLVVGILVLLVINLVRIVSLYYTGIYFPSAFEAMHIDVWQPAFIVLALFLWMIWLRWATQTETVEGDVAA